ncbi:glycosyltransferase family 4 protein [Vibrio breoganii]
MNVIIVGAFTGSLINFRGKLIEKLSKSNCNVITMSGMENEKPIYRTELEMLGANHLSYPVSRNGLNPIQDFVTLLSLIRNFRTYKPKVVLAYTIKPVIWGGIASRFSNNSSFYAMITGLGYAFQKGGFKKTLLNNVVKVLYKLSLSKSKSVIFQNRDNMQVFIDEGIVAKEKCHLVNGSGVDLNHYKPIPLPSKAHFLLIARLLGDKGIREYAKAAEVIKQKYPSVIFELVGPEDPSPDGITLDEVNEWVNSGIIKYSGSASDVRPFIENCSVYVLPSYHEGMPRTVLEAMAMGRPILTTDVPGCRETVVNGDNGWLVEKANVEQLVKRMIWFIENQNQWSNMGQKSHRMATDKFDVHKVNDEILRIMGLVDEKGI